MYCPSILTKTEMPSQAILIVEQFPQLARDIEARRFWEVGRAEKKPTEIHVTLCRIVRPAT